LEHFLKTSIQKYFIAACTFFLWMSVFAVELPTEELSKLAIGDIIFWAVQDAENRAGHVAVVVEAHDDSKWIRIAHATDHPAHNAFVITHIKTSKQLEKHQRYYRVFRCKDTKIVHSFLGIIHGWLADKIPFNKVQERKMNQWDDATVKLSAEDKLQLQQALYQKEFVTKEGLKNKVPTIPRRGLMCSDSIIVGLQAAYTESIGAAALPLSLQLSALCPPSIFMFALIQDKNNFQELVAVKIL